MIEDQPVHMDRVRAIEATMDAMKSQHEATHQLLQDVLARLGPAQAQNVQDPLPTRPARRSPTPSIPASSAGRKKLALKPSFPPDFSGDQAARKAFLTSCQTYICLCPEAFEDDLTKVIWAMSYMKTGRANRWATREFEQEAKAGQLRFIDWLDFEEEFRKDFMPLDSESAAINVLEMTAYFQGKRTVDDYLDQFRDLIYDSGYTDPKTVAEAAPAQVGKANKAQARHPFSRNGCKMYNDPNPSKDDRHYGRNIHGGHGRYRRYRRFH